MKNLKNIFSYLIFSSGIILLICLYTRLFIFELISLFNRNFDVPIVLDSVWVVALFWLLYSIMKKIGMYKDKIIFNFVIIIFTGVIITLIGMGFSSIPQIEKFEIIKSNYTGLSGVDEVEYEKLFDEGTKNVYTNSFLFSKGDKKISEEVKNLKEEHNNISERDFIFWQTGLAAKYNPKYIPEYKGVKSFFDRLILFFTVGPIVIFENLIKALQSTILFLIFPIISLFFKKRLFFSNFKELKDYLLKDLPSADEHYF